MVNDFHLVTLSCQQNSKCFSENHFLKIFLKLAKGHDKS